MRNLLLLLFVTFAINTFAQEIGKEVREGKTYRIHVVEKGNTLYGLQMKYEVTMEEIIEANPSVKEGLQIGQKIYIPTSENSGDSATNDDVIIHVVKKKETLYGIAKTYGVLVEEIVRLNPEANEGLKIGEELKIPQKSKTTVSNLPKEETKVKEILEDSKQEKVEKIQHNPGKYKIDLNDSIIDYEVQQKETIYSISKRFMVSIDTIKQVNDLKGNGIQEGQILKIPLKRERVAKVEIKKIERFDTLKRIDNQLTQEKETYKVLVALPLKISSNPDILSGMFSNNTSINSLTNIGLEFLMGAQMALDSLEKLGLNAKVEFFDTEANLAVLKEKLKENNPEEWDLIIGPFYPELYSYASVWGKNNKVPTVAVTKISPKELENNPYAFSVVPSNLTLIGGMAKYLAAHALEDNIVIISGENSEIKSRVEYFIDTYNKYSKGNTIRQTSIGDSEGNHLRGYINTEKKNYVICLSEDVQQVMKFINTLNAAKNHSIKYGKADVFVVGLREWRDISALNSYYKNRFHFHYAGTKYLNYDTEKSIAFLKEYRTKYESDPSKFAFHGFDVMLSQCASLLLKTDRSEGVMNYFNMQTIGTDNGKENAVAFIAKQNDFEIELLEIIGKEKPKGE